MSTDSASPAAVSVPRVVIKRRRALPFFSRHPWVFAGAIERIEGSPEPGDEVALFSSEGKFIARGFYNPHSNIRVRLYCWEEGRPLDESFFEDRLYQAISWRRRLFADAGPDAAYRVVYSEADGLSGLIVDRYADCLLVQFTSLAIARRREMFVRLLDREFKPSSIWLRTEKGIREAEALDVSDGLLHGQEPSRPLFIDERGVRFGIDVEQGQKTGFFLDQRDNRAALGRYVHGHRVLDMFCYTGGFALSAVKQGGAREALGIDTSEAAVATARANAELNGVAEKVRFEQGDAFETLERLQESGETFDTVILDPPKLARHRSGLKKALRAYFSLNRLAVDLLNPDGILVTCSCSGHVGRDLFEQMLAQVALDADRPLQILEARGQAADHPTSVHCMEGSYLKCYICRAL